MNRAYGSFFLVFCVIDWTKVQPYKMLRTYGSDSLCNSSVGTIHIVATDFNPLNVRTKHFIATNGKKSPNIFL